MKNLMEQRICSSIQAGIKTARMLLEGLTVHEVEDEREVDLSLETGEERAVLERLIARLERIEHDPKLNAMIHRRLAGLLGGAIGQGFRPNDEYRLGRWVARRFEAKPPWMKAIIC